MSTADILAGVVTDLQPVAYDLALPDTCAVVRRTPGPPDTRGNPTFTESVVALYRCRLRSGQLRPTEQVIADQVRATAPYAIDLPKGADVSAADVLDVGLGTFRRFEAIGVLTDGGYGMFTTVIAEERS